MGIKISRKIENEHIYKVISLIIGCLLIIIGFKDRYLLKFFLGVLLIFFYTYNSDAYLTEKGLVYIYKGFLLNRRESLEFNNMNEIVIMKQKKNSVIFFVKEPMAKKVIIDNGKFNEIIEFINNNSKNLVRIESKI